MISVGLISGFMVGIEWSSDDFLGSQAIIFDLGIVRIVWEWGFE